MSGFSKRRQRVGSAAWALGLAIGLAPCVLWAAEGHEVQMESPFTLLWRFVNFAALAALLIVFLRKPIANFLNKRREDVRASLDEAQRAREEAESRYRDVERRLAQAQKEMEELREMIIEQGRIEKEKILFNARQEADKIRKQAEITAEQELKKAQQALRQEALELASSLAEAILRDRIEAKDHERLIENYVETLGKTGR